MPDKLIGKVTHYFDKIGVAVVKAENEGVAVGDSVKFKHGDKEFAQMIGSLEVDKISVGKIVAGQEAGLKVDEEVKEGWEVYKIVEWWLLFVVCGLWLMLKNRWMVNLSQYKLEIFVQSC